MTCEEAMNDETTRGGKMLCGEIFIQDPVTFEWIDVLQTIKDLKKEISSLQREIRELPKDFQSRRIYSIDK